MIDAERAANPLFQGEDLLNQQKEETDKYADGKESQRFEN